MAPDQDTPALCKESLHTAAPDIETLQAQLAQVTAERDVMAEALRPFAAEFRDVRYEPQLRDQQVIECQTRNEVLHLEVRVADFRRARVALNSIAKDESRDGREDG